MNHKLILGLAILITIALPGCISKPHAAETSIPLVKINPPSTYQKTLIATKSFYPFGHWRRAYALGLKQYTSENCNKAQQIFDNLINCLVYNGSSALKEDKIALFKTAVFSLNKLNDEVEGLIETGEREDLCALIDRIASAAGLNPKDFGEGAGIADEWRSW